MTEGSAIYQQIVSLARPYLGPSTEAFITRQCSYHLKISPSELMASHLDELVKWVELSAGLIMDKSRVGELREQLLSLKRTAA